MKEDAAAARQGPTGAAAERLSGGRRGGRDSCGASLSSLAVGGTEANKRFFSEAAVLSICQSMLGRAVLQGRMWHFWCPWF